jgi:hypothetical protein
MVLLGLGVRHMSLMPADVGPVKTMLRSLNCGRLAEYLRQLYDLPDHSLRVRLRGYALDHGVQLHVGGWEAVGRRLSAPAEGFSQRSDRRPADHDVRTVEPRSRETCFVRHMKSTTRSIRPKP